MKIGPAGWSYSDWEGKVYPRPRPRGFHPLPYLARYLNCIEINSSFYATPRADHARAWTQHVRDVADFTFTAKLQDVFTHQGFHDVQALRDEADRFRAGIAPLREAGRLGCLLCQFPFSFRRSRGASSRLAWIRETFCDENLVLEVRHRSWFDSAARDEISHLGYNLATLDLPSHPDHPPAFVDPTGPIGYLRLHGRNQAAWFDSKAGRDQRYDYLYDKDELSRLAETARRLASGTDETYLVTNNHFAGKAVANAIELRAELEVQPVLAPRSLVATYPRLEDVTRPEAGQGELFG